MWFSTKSRPSLGLSPIALCVLKIDGSHIGRDQSKQHKPKDQDEKMVEINLATHEGELQPIFVNANLPAELR